jgi:hypothetical protein
MRKRSAFTLIKPAASTARDGKGDRSINAAQSIGLVALPVLLRI